MINFRKILAFSLIELLIVIAIIGILIATGVPSYSKYLQRANLSEAIAILGEYRTAIGVYWSTIGSLPGPGDTLIGTPADLPFNTLVTENLPNSVQSLLLSDSGNGILITLVVQANIFADYSANNRTLYLGAISSGSELLFQCGNFTTNATSTSDMGFTDISLLPYGCNFNGVGDWLNN